MKQPGSGARTHAQRVQGEARLAEDNAPDDQAPQKSLLKMLGDLASVIATAS